MSDRYRAAEFPPDHRGRVLWGIQDTANGGVWVETGGEVERYTLEEGAQGWIARQKYLNETVMFRT